MTVENKTDNDIKLNSELPIKQLLALSRSLDEQHYQRAYLNHKQHSPFLNPVAPVGTRLISNIFFDHDSLVRLFKEYTTSACNFLEQGKIPAGVIGSLEYDLRKLYQLNEQILKREGRSADTPIDAVASRKIAEHSARLMVAIEESKKMDKLIKEHDAAKAAEVEIRRSHSRNGSVKRSGGDGVISSVDGMSVKNGIIVDLNQPIAEYLDEVRKEKERKRAAQRAAAQENISN